MPDPATRTLQLRRTFATSPAAVFDAWTTPAVAGGWLFATPSGVMTRVEMDVRPGGAWSVVERRDGVEVEHVGAYVVVDRPKHLVFTFRVPLYSPASTQVAIEIEPQGPGCELALTHTGVLPEWAEPTAQGWTKLLAALARRLDHDAHRTAAGE